MLFPDAYIKQTEGGHLYEFGCCWDKTANKSNLQKEEFIFGSVWRYSQFITQSEDPVLEMVLPMFRMNLAFSVKPFWGHAHRQRLRCISMAVLNPFNLTVSSNRFTTCSPSLLKTFLLPHLTFELYLILEVDASRKVAKHSHLSTLHHFQGGDGVCWSHSFCTLYAAQVPWWLFSLFISRCPWLLPCSRNYRCFMGKVSVDILLYQLSSTKHS